MTNAMYSLVNTSSISFEWVFFKFSNGFYIMGSERRHERIEKSQK